MNRWSASICCGALSAVLGGGASAAPGDPADAASAPTVASPAAGVLEYSGTAVDRDSGSPLYHEQHFLRFDARRPVERVVLYTCSDGRPFGRKTVSYAVDVLAPDFVMESAFVGHREGLRGADTRQRTVFYQSAGSAAEQSANLPIAAGMVADAGFDEFVRRHWDALLRGESQRFEFLVPSRLQSFSFKLRWLRSEQLDGEPAEVMRLGLTGLWGLIAPDIEVKYRRRDRVLMRYEGVTNVRDRRGENYAARIDFPPQQRRIVADSAGLEAARKAVLVTSCT